MPILVKFVLRDTRGRSFVEYIVLAGVVALLAVGAWRRLGGSITGVTERHANHVRDLDSVEGTASEGAPAQRAAADRPGAASEPDLQQSGVPGEPGEGPALAGGTGDLMRAAAASAALSSPPARPAPPSAADVLVAGVLKVMCPKDAAFLQDLKARGVTITGFDKIYFDDPYFDGTVWTTKRFNAGGTTFDTDIKMIRSGSGAENAATIYHEGVHTGQPSGLAWREKEYDAYVKEDQWRISHGLAPHTAAFRKKDASGKDVTNVAAVRAFVDKNYPGVTSKSSSGAAPEEIIGSTPGGKTVVRRSDGTTYERAPKKGDSFPGPETTVPPGGIPIDMAKLQCP